MSFTAGTLAHTVEVGIDGVEVAAPTDHPEPWPAIDQVHA